MSVVRWLSVAVLWVSPGIAGPIPLVNPGFETGNFSGWMQSGNPGHTSVLSGAAHGGIYSARFGPIGSLGYISQYVPTVPGGVYDVTFYLMGSGTPNRVEVWWDGSLAGSWSDVGLSSWTLLGAFGLVTSHSSTELRLGFRDDPWYLYLDDVSVEGIEAIPEPSTLALLGTGVLVLLLRRRK